MDDFEMMKNGIVLYECILFPDDYYTRKIICRKFSSPEINLDAIKYARDRKGWTTKNNKYG